MDIKEEMLQKLLSLDIDLEVAYYWVDLNKGRRILPDKIFEDEAFEEGYYRLWVPYIKEWFLS